MRGALEVDELTGERWDLALGLLASGEGAGSISTLNLLRDAAGPRANGTLLIEIRTSSHSPHHTRASAGDDVIRGLAQLQELLADLSFAALADLHGYAITLVDDYDTGRVALADVSTDGSIVWRSDSEPSA